MKIRFHSQLLVPVLVGVSLVLAACDGGRRTWGEPFSTAGIPVDEEISQSQFAIIGGTDQTGENAVVLIAIDTGGGNYQAFCTGTLIGKRTVLTAAHCFEDATPQEQYAIAIGASTRAVSAVVTVQTFVNNPNYQGATGQGRDVTVLRLTTDVPNITPYQINDTALTNADVGKNVRHVGFGNNNGGNANQAATGFGTKREATFPIRRLTAFEYESGANGRQTCTGDSGGPGFMVTAGNSNPRIIGTVSYGDQFCNVTGFDTRVDTVAAFIRTSAAAWEALGTCVADNVCVPGCTTPDPDCAACGSDGTCNQTCSADPDCGAIGTACASAATCAGNQCVTDAQHPATYCSQSCDAQKACPSGFTCDNSVCKHEQLPEVALGEACDATTACADANVCTGTDAAATTCERACSSTALCGSGESCIAGVNGLSFCRAAVGGALIDTSGGVTPESSANATTEDPTAGVLGGVVGGCSAGAAGMLPGLGLLTLLAVARRRRS